jgi:hypothetical protein
MKGVVHMYSKIKPFIIMNNVQYIENEKWLPVFDPEYSIKPYYIISDYGRIFSTSRGSGKLMSPVMNEDGYLRIQLSLTNGIKRYFQLHRLVLYTFNYVPGCEKLQVNHKDTIKTHNWVYNLEWVTCRENILHAIASGVFAQLGESNNNCNTTDEQVHKVCQMWMEGYSINDIAKTVNVSISNVSNIVSGSSRKYITSRYNLQKRQENRLTENEVHEVCKFIQDNKCNYKLMKELDQAAAVFIGKPDKNTITAISHVRNRDTYTKISNNYNF